MNKNYSRNEEYRPRWLAALLRDAVKDHPVVVVTGARQVGKSTLLQNESPFKDWRYRTLDDYDAQAQARERPSALWAGTDRVVLDEVQRVPELLSAVKLAVDQSRDLRFVLSGSANLLLMKAVSETLAGRAVYFVLDPMSIGEQKGKPNPEILHRLLKGEWPIQEEWLLKGERPLKGERSEEQSTDGLALDPVPMMLQGLMPALLTISSPAGWTRWWEGYVSTYLERDLRQVSQIDALVDFRRVMELLALRSAQVLNQSDLARDAGLSQPTVHRYLNLLEATHLFERLPAFRTNRMTRLVKSPKVFWTDPGLAVFLAGYFSVEELRGARELGSLLEVLVYHHLRIQARLLTPAARLTFWRTRSGVEVDFVLERGSRRVAFEVKSTQQPRFRDVKGLREFLSIHPDTVGGILLHTGTEVSQLDDRIVALPWTVLIG